MRVRVWLLGLGVGLILGLPVAAEPTVERGEYLVRGPAACGNCHTPWGPLTDNKHDKRMGPIAGMEMAGQVFQEPFGQVPMANITPGSRIADWSNEELKRAIREGIRPDGSVIGPPMPIPLYRHLSDTDVESIVLFLRTVPAVKNELPPSQYNFPLPPAYGPPVGHVADIPTANTVEYGAYLAGPIAHCTACHTPMGPKGPMMDRVGQGGMEFHGPWGMVVASNITSDPTALGQYTDAEIKQMITKGIHPSGLQMMPPMPYAYFAKMTNEDLDALVAYLRTIPPHPVSD